jgi:hypothetical protein
MTPCHTKSREEAQQFRSFYDRMDELIQWMIDVFGADRDPPATGQGKLPLPSTPEVVPSTPPALPTPEIEQQAVLTNPAAQRKVSHDQT